ncbi:MAG: alpha-L-fucosidase [Gammaproteobacteria bacterium]|nr:alpha-L-fucosidase [Gammaproteobacteria bacterium]
MTAAAVAAAATLSWPFAAGTVRASAAQAQPAAQAQAAAQARHAARTTQVFPPLWNEPKDYERALHRQLARVDSRIARGPFEARWQSLEAYRVPGWFRDAKFGIFIHWGVFSVPAFDNEWYSRNMYVHGSVAYEYHRAVYGPQSKFGYKDFIPRFTMAKFDPDAWADLFVRAGARYVVPVAEHSDGFAMYDSKFTLWDAARMGPKRDVVAALEKAVRARGMRFGVSSHRAEHWWWNHEGTEYNSDVNDPRYAGLYGPAEPMHLPGDPDTGEPDPNHLERWLPPSQAYVEDWLARSTELVDDYHPDFIYFDWWINQPAFAPDLKRMAAYYYDVAAARHQDVVLTYKLQAFPPGAAVLDIERGKLDALRLHPWQSDTSVSINSWGYVKDDSYRTAGSLLTDLIDIVSKNGNLLLNIGPRADGTIPQQVRTVLLQIGAWLRVNGEAIYGTRPWVLYGEGTTNAPSGREAGQVYTPADIRFTQKDGALYAMGLAWPRDGKVLIKTLYSGTPYLTAPVAQVALLGDAAPVTWQQTPQGLAVQLPPPHDDLPYALRILTRK